jgi:hypothetical protein
MMIEGTVSISVSLTEEEPIFSKDGLRSTAPQGLAVKKLKIESPQSKGHLSAPHTIASAPLIMMRR